MKKGLMPVLLVSAMILILLLMNIYGRRNLQIGLTAWNMTEGEVWQSYTPHLTLPEGEYEVFVRGEGAVMVRSGEGNLLGSGNAQDKFVICLEKDESDIVVYGQREGYISSLEVARTQGGTIYSDDLFMSLGIGAAVLAVGLLRVRRIGREPEKQQSL